MLRTYFLFLGTLLYSTLAAASNQNLFDLSIDDLEKLEVTSVSKQAERRFEAPASVYVLTNDDIRRSGANSIPEVLRQVPGLEVAQIDSNKWAISARGFNRQFVNKLLVLVDGRSVYTPLFSGTYWDIQNQLLEDIERIEVIKGPGASLWGANAVNGVINIITKDAELTQGTYLEAGIGTFETLSTSARYGGKVGDTLFYRTTVNHDDFDSTKMNNGTDAHDDWSRSSANLRLDWNPSHNDKLTFILDGHKGQLSKRNIFPDMPSTTVLGDEEFHGFNLISRWEHHSENTNHQLQVYIDHISRDMEHLLDQSRTTFDIDWQQDIMLSDRLDVIWGLGYRYFVDRLESDLFNGTRYLDYSPDKSHNNLYSGFIQTKYALLPKELYLTLGSKFEHNFYTDFEYQPNARISWLPSQNQTLWASVSRAVRVPSRGERSINLSVIAAGSSLIALGGNRTFDSEKLMAYEMGYRIEPFNWMMLDTSFYYNDYNDLRSFEPNGSTVIPVGNFTNAKNKGAEISARFNVTPELSITANYHYFDFDLYHDSGSSDTLTEADEGTSPEHRFSLLTRYNILPNLEFDSNIYYTDSLESSSIDDYLRVDLRLAYRPIENVELSITGQNLSDSSHQEFSPFLFAQSSEIPRSIFAKAAIKF